MELYKTTSFLWYYLTILLAFCQVLEAQAPAGPKKERVPLPALPTDEPLPAKDSLQIKLDRDLYAKGSLVFSSHLEFENPQTITASQMKRIAVDAYDEMRSMAKKNGIPERDMPRVMTTLIIGKELIFASSAKGPQTPYGQDSQVQADLDACRGPGDKGHKHNGRCGEVMALHEYYQSHGVTERLEKESGARIVAIAGTRNAKGQLEKVIYPPCGSKDDWGCNRLVQQLDVLDDAKVDKDKDTPAFRYKNMINNPKPELRPVDPTSLSKEKEKEKPKPGGSNDGEFEEPPKYDESTAKEGKTRRPQQPNRNKEKTGAQDNKPSQSGEQENDEDFEEPPKYEEPTENEGKTRRPQQPNRNKEKPGAQDNKPSQPKEQDDGGDFEEPPKYEEPTSDERKKGKTSQKDRNKSQTNTQKKKTGNRPRHFQG
ncbi:hypothetical protein MHUMG1_09198 [Metarhizium humberi]|uniref:SCP domain-containing protein n=1 Tax=Metarhizium humberi TaxID=2596975 RepID=A0A9P8S3Q6_9HYPO|nr:hypothetical protein MHUMG1_09198 [Metarhizium humberi]